MRAAPGDERIRRGPLPNEHGFDYLRLRCELVDRAAVQTLDRLETRLPVVAVQGVPAHPAPGPTPGRSLRQPPSRAAGR